MSTRRRATRKGLHSAFAMRSSRGPERASQAGAACRVVVESLAPGGFRAPEARSGADGAHEGQLPSSSEGVFTFQGRAWGPAAEGCAAEGWEEGESASLEVLDLGDGGDAGRRDGVVGLESAGSSGKEAGVRAVSEVGPRRGEASGDGAEQEDGPGDFESRHAYKDGSVPHIGDIHSGELENDSDGAIESLECFQAEEGEPGERWGRGEEAKGSSEMVLSAISVCPSRSDSRRETSTRALPLTPIAAPSAEEVYHVLFIEVSGIYIFYGGILFIEVAGIKHIGHIINIFHTPCWCSTPKR